MGGFSSAGGAAAAGDVGAATTATDIGTTTYFGGTAADVGAGATAADTGAAAGGAAGGAGSLLADVAPAAAFVPLFMGAMGYSYGTPDPIHFNPQGMTPQQYQQAQAAGWVVNPDGSLTWPLGQPAPMDYPGARPVIAGQGDVSPVTTSGGSGERVAQHQ